MATPAMSPRPGASHAAHTTSRLQRSTSMTKPSTTLHPTAPLSPRMNGIVKTPSHIVTHKSKMPGTPSPNYFGLTINAHADHFSSSAAQHIRGNWSPPTSDVRSTAAASPRIIPVEQNPEFEQFRKQSQNNRAFALGSFDFASSAQAAPTQSPFFNTIKAPLSPQSMTPSVPAPGTKGAAKDENEEAPKPRSPKRMLSSESALFPDRPRRNSPASFEGIGRTDAIAEFAEDRVARPSLPSKPSQHPSAISHRAETLPATFEDDIHADGPTMVTAQHIVNILQSSVEEVLLLDLRVSTQYARAHIAGALSLCIPTTLLKRASFNVQKLAETFKDDEQREKFERWRSSKHIIVYDANSSQMKDATTCINTLKKFTGEGWTGGTFIIRGGFKEFSERFPTWITHQASQSPTSGTAALTLGSDLPSVAPVIGGCPMPVTQNAANPFFGNIRQNMDLIGGVGQMPVKHPEGMTRSVEDELPQWLKEASEEKDNGKTVSERFLAIEKREQKRMQEALSGKVSYGTPSGSRSAKAIQIAGIEKGSKNRYNNIWPYEHSRVKLQGVPEGNCDYVNANHVQAAYSNKRYIATQGPIPATFKDFWNVVWQQDVRVIVMLTAEQEGGQIKAHNYWSDKRYGHLRLDNLGERRASLEPSKIYRHREQSRPTMSQRRSTTNNPPKGFNFTTEATTGSPSQEQPYVIVRKFTLSNDEEPFARMREITQLQYSHWPDFGAPAHPTHLLGLIEQTDAVVRSVNGGTPSQPESTNSRPIVVHCSAGCGRTGTFCTVDSVLDMLKRQRQARRARQSTPMEVDSGITSRNKNEREEGTWITNEEIDLIAKTVEDFRLQRLSMVQSLRQFVLCYESVMEWLVEQHPKSA
ncbi:tyrosine-protein phosphatase-like protein non-receptor [Plenodomus tracheiphilus IPT5]|uniref:protein-tyrosine-phosphatase n=1 Tax=Plenodomus tracheiphilus IPT5 TaxID=1408161 RepID=A0A6A7BBB0_9PLEO|nr:tyrosine-protein phosphatase-like protein non-receptor [Plenodomus tracheiphilus IPT5]